MAAGGAHCVPRYWSKTQQEVKMKNRIGLKRACEALTGMTETTKSPLSGKKAALAAAVAAALGFSAGAHATTYVAGQGEDIVVTQADAGNGGEQYRVIGGWRDWNETAAAAPLNNTVTVESGTWNMVVGGHYSGGKDKSIAHSVESTHVVVNGGSVFSLVGGTGASNNLNVTHINENAVSNVTINGGSFGFDGEVGNATELFVLGGDLMKHGGSFESIVDAYAESYIGTTNVRITDGTFNSAIVGGSAAIVYYGNADKGAKTTVNTTNVTIEGGTFNHGIVAGGLASGHKTHSIVHEANLSIVKKDKDLVINDNVFAGGLLRTDGLSGSDHSVTVDHAVMRVEGVAVNGGIYGTHAALKGDVSTSDSDKISEWHYDPLELEGSKAFVRTDLTMVNASAKEVALGTGSTLTAQGVVELESLEASGVAISLLAAPADASAAQARATLSQTGTELNIGTLTGTGNTLYFGTADASVNIGGLAEGTDAPFTGITGSGSANDDLGGDLGKLTDLVSINGESGSEALVGAELKLEQGDVFGETTGTVDENGTVVTEAQAVNTKNLQIARFAMTTPMQIARIEANDLRKRMGDVRASEGTSGAWVRYDGGKFSGSDGYENTFNKIQLGVDTVPTADAPRLGLAFSYTMGDAEMDIVSADTDAYSLSAYGMWFGEAGQFADVIARMGTVKTDLSTDTYKADYDQMMFSLSGEFGWRFDVTDAFFAEPSVELTYARVGGETYRANGNAFTIDDYDSMVGKLGMAAGLNCPQAKGSVYARLGVAHEFLGDGKFTATTAGGASSAVEVDGKDTWFEYAVGANFNLSSQTYVWADLERTAGAEVDVDWRATVGIRHAF
mgnify:CR=1 FL=1